MAAITSVAVSRQDQTVPTVPLPFPVSLNLMSDTLSSGSPPCLIL